MSDKKHTFYAYRVMWSHEDEEFVGLCSEFPSLSFLAETQSEALKGMIKLIEDILEDMQESGEKPPEPISGRSFSGKTQLRMTPDLHRRLTVEASEQSVSLNRLINDKLASATC